MSDAPNGDYGATPGECLTLGGHDSGHGQPCSRCGWTPRQRPPAVPKPKCCGGRWNGASIVHKDDCPRRNDGSGGEVNE